MSPVAQVFRSGFEELRRVSHIKKENPHGGVLTTDLGGGRKRNPGYETGDDRGDYQTR